MITAAVLLVYAAVLAIAGPLALRRAAWGDRAPRLGVLAWQALSASVVLGVVFSGVALTVPTLQVSTNLSELLQACALALRAQYATPGGALAGAAGAIVAAAVLTRGSYGFVVTFARAAAMRRRQHRMLALVGRTHRRPGVTLLDHDDPVVYCVAGTPHRIVLTAGADNVLDDAQLAAVLAHERAHLRERHHVAVGAAAALARAFPGVPVFRHAQAEISRLVELLADDAAGHDGQRLHLAGAMLELASQAPPAGALAARGTSAAARIRRLISGHRPLGAARTMLGLAVAAAVLVLPALVLAMPAAMAGPECCTSPAMASREHTGAACQAARADGTCPF